MNKVSAIILAAGSGSRFGEKKQFKKLNGSPIWTYSLDTLNKSNCFQEFILVVSEESLNELKNSEEFFQKLEIPHRVMLLSSGDMGKDEFAGILKIWTPLPLFTH